MKTDLFEETDCPTMGTALISSCGRYRTRLTRHVGDGAPYNWLTFIMLNPSTADAGKDDPTIRKCRGFARRLGFTFFQVVNLFDFRATDPKDLMKAAEPCSAENLKVILECARYSEMTICAWGTHGTHQGQDKRVLKLLQYSFITLYALGVTKDGHPRHPLYVPYDTKPVEFPAKVTS